MNNTTTERGEAVTELMDMARRSAADFLAAHGTRETPDPSDFVDAQVDAMLDTAAAEIVGMDDAIDIFDLRLRSEIKIQKSEARSGRPMETCPNCGFFGPSADMVDLTQEGDLVESIVCAMCAKGAVNGR
jgi:hypothetical protein